MSFLSVLIQNLNADFEHVFLFYYFFAQKIPLFRKTTQRFIDNIETLVSKEYSHEYLPYTTQKFWYFQISLINNWRHPRGHCIHESSTVLSISLEPQRSQGSQVSWGRKGVPGFLGVPRFHGCQEFSGSQRSWNYETLNDCVNISKRSEAAKILF